MGRPGCDGRRERSHHRLTIPVSAGLASRPAGPPLRRSANRAAPLGAFIVQFCELPDDVVFTVEYSIRSAQTAVYALLGLERAPPAVYQGKYDPRVLYKAYRALHDVRC
jgi:myosin-crossreactive antigen